MTETNCALQEYLVNTYQPLKEASIRINKNTVFAASPIEAARKGAMYGLYTLIAIEPLQEFSTVTIFVGDFYVPSYGRGLPPLSAKDVIIAVTPMNKGEKIEAVRSECV